MSKLINLKKEAVQNTNQIVKRQESGMFFTENKTGQ